MPMTCTLLVARITSPPSGFVPIVTVPAPDVAARIAAHSATAKTAFLVGGLAAPGLVLRQQITSFLNSTDQRTGEEFANAMADIVEGYVGACLTLLAGHIDWHFNAHGHASVFPATPPALSVPAPPPFT